jgi:hypothetical protein
VTFNPTEVAPAVFAVADIFAPYKIPEFPVLFVTLTIIPLPRPDEPVCCRVLTILSADIV